MRAAILVLRDLGRSPRMQYHALALAANDVDTDLIGIAGASAPAGLKRTILGKGARDAAKRGWEAEWTAHARGVVIHRPHILSTS